MVGEAKEIKLFLRSFNLFFFFLVIHTPPWIGKRGLGGDWTHTLEQHVTLAFHLSYQREDKASALRLALGDLIMEKPNKRYISGHRWAKIDLGKRGWEDEWIQFIHIHKLMFLDFASYQFADTSLTWSDCHGMQNGEAKFHRS